MNFFLRIIFRAETFPDKVVGLAQMRFDRACGNIQNFSYFLMRQAMKTAQSIYTPSDRRHGRHKPQQTLLQEMTVHNMFRSAFRNGSIGKDILLVYVLYHKMGITVGKDVFRNREDITGKVPVFINNFSCLPKSDESVLHNVLGDGNIAGCEFHNEIEQLHVIIHVKLLKSLGRAFLKFQYAFLFVHALS